MGFGLDHVVEVWVINDSFIQSTDIAVGIDAINKCIRLTILNRDVREINHEKAEGEEDDEAEEVTAASFFEWTDVSDLFIDLVIVTLIVWISQTISHTTPAFRREVVD